MSLISFHRLGNFGRVGNQLFQYAYLRSQANRMGVQYACPHWWGDDIFDLNETGRLVSSKPCPNEYREPKHCSGLNACALEIQPHTNVLGYFQTEKYFHPNVRTWFRFRTEKFLPKLSDYTSIHFRFGDYLKLEDVYHPLPDSYYLNALEYVGADRIAVFSDDVKLARRKMKTLGIRRYKLFKRNNEAEDLMAMASCGRNVISNSSFGWWGAWFAQNRPGSVIYPKTWFHPTYDVKNPDIGAEGWTGL